ncbi:MAG: hypothetical protein GQ532_19775 [Methylomarinum sp.]|nr:hypothetical protein [Methylomarinum sp.]
MWQKPGNSSENSGRITVKHQSGINSPILDCLYRRNLLMQLFINIVSTFVLLLGMLWALLPGGFGLNNFNTSHAPPLTYLAMGTWGILILTHLFVLYKIWSGQENVYWWILLPLLMHIIFFTIFGRDVSTG